MHSASSSASGCSKALSYSDCVTKKTSPRGHLHSAWEEPEKSCRFSRKSEQILKEPTRTLVVTSRLGKAGGYNNG